MGSCSCRYLCNFQKRLRSATVNWPRRCSSSLGVPGLRALSSLGGGDLGLTERFFLPSLDRERRRDLDCDRERERRFDRLAEPDLDLRLGSLRLRSTLRSRDESESLEDADADDADVERRGARFLRRDAGGGAGDLSLDFEPDLSDLSLDTEPLLA